MAEEKHCDECGGKLPADTPQGLCPQCLMKLGLPSTADAESSIPTSPTAPAPFVPPEPKQLAKRFPQLEIVELLGQGGMGAVYKARQKHLDRLVALKILPPEISRDPAFAERFTREARSLAKLNHPQIVTVFEFGHTEDGLYYFIMEYIDGTDLRQIIKTDEFSPKEALAIVPQICAALQFAHEEGIVHRDIKPENILIDKKGRIKIADFGLARLLDQPAKAYTLTQAGQRMGTPHYMAPEQIEHPAQVDHRADIYSLGVVFYEMLTGELPIGRFDPPSQKVQIDVRLDEIVLHTLEKEPQRRYQHASQVKTDIETVSSTESPQPAPAPDKAPKPSRMDKHITIVAALYIGFGFLGLFFAIIASATIVGGGIITRDQTVMRITAILGPFVSLLVGAASIPGIIGGFGLLKRKPWARILVIIIAIFGMLKFPFGTILGVYALWVLLQSETAKLFAAASAAPSQTGTPKTAQFSTTPSPRAPQPEVHVDPPQKAADIDIRQDARHRLRVPAIALMIAGILSCLVVPLVLAGLILTGLLAEHIDGFNFGVRGSLMMAFLAPAMIAGVLITIGASQMLRLRSYGLSVATAILALLPCYAGIVIGLPFAIWALVVLSGIKVQAAFAKEKQHPTQTKPHPATTLFIFLLIAIIVSGSGVLIVRALPRLSNTNAALAGTPLSFNLELPSDKIGQFDFPAGRTDHITCNAKGFALSDQGASALELTPDQRDRINEILQTAYADYAELERKNSQFSTSANSLKVLISPFRQQAAEFLEKLWPKIDAIVDQAQQPLIHKNLPLGRIFGTFGFGEYKVSINISKKGDRFAYSVSWHRTEGPGPMGQVANISSDSSRTLPFDLHRFWNAEFETTAAKRSESSVDKYAAYGTSPPDPCISP